MARDDERAFAFLRLNQREEKPRQRGLTEIRGPYYSALGPRYLRDLLETVGHVEESAHAQCCVSASSFAMSTQLSV
jgi:hypothetical protein